MWSLNNGGKWCGDEQCRGGIDQLNHPLDLINVPETCNVKVWINVYPDLQCWTAFMSKSGADCFAAGRIACIEREITYTVGEGL